MGMIETDIFDDFFIVRHKVMSDEYTMHSDPSEAHPCEAGWTTLSYKLDPKSDVDVKFKCDRCGIMFKVNYQFTDTYKTDTGEHT